MLTWSELDAAVRAGSVDTARRSAAAEAYQFYRRKMQAERKNQETDADFNARPKAFSFLLYGVVCGLTRFLYSRAPMRALQPAIEGGKIHADIIAWANRVWETTNINAVMQTCDRIATIGGAAAIQIKPMADPKYPVRYFPYWAHEFAVWTEPSDPDNPYAIATFSASGGRQYAQLWTKDHYANYTSATLTRYSDDIVRDQTGRQIPGACTFSSRGPIENPYGVVPFAYFHDELAMRDFWTTEGVGESLVQLNKYLNRELCDIANMRQFNMPMLVGTGIPSGQKIYWKPGGIVTLHSAGLNVEAATSSEPNLTTVSAETDLAGRYTQLVQDVRDRLKEIGIPPVALRMDDSASSAPSGLALMIAEGPLVDHAVARQVVARIAEMSLWLKTVYIAAAWTKDQLAKNRSNELLKEYVTLKGGLGTGLEISWPERKPPVPTPEMDAAITAKIQGKRMSVIQSIMEDRSLTEKQAIAYLERIKAHEDIYKGLFGDPEAGGEGGGGDMSEAEMAKWLEGEKEQAATEAVQEVQAATDVVQQMEAGNGEEGEGDAGG